jgi:hypothetical protein
MDMRTRRNRLLIGILLLICFINLLPPAQSQEMYQGFFWVTDVGYPLSAISATGDLNADHIQLSEIVVAGRGALTLLDGITGLIMCHYNISPTSTFNALAVGNLDTDPANEIGAGSKDGNLLSILKYNPTSHNFTLLWEKQYNVTHIAIADIIGDSLNEVLISDLEGNLTVFFHNGTLCWSTPLNTTIQDFTCLDFSQDNVTDRILVFRDSCITLLNSTGLIEWQVEVTSKPQNGLLGDVLGNQDQELVLKLQNYTLCLAQNGTSLWNSPLYMADYPGLLLYNYTDDSYPEIFLSTSNGTYSLSGTNGTLIHRYLTNSSVTSLVIGNLFGGVTDYLIIGDTQNITYWTLEGSIFMIVPLTGAVLDILLLEMNNNGIPDIATASANGTIYVIGLPWFVDFTWIFVGIAIGSAVIIISIYVAMKTKSPKPKAPSPAFTP